MIDDDASYVEISNVFGRVSLSAALSEVTDKQCEIHSKEKCSDAVTELNGVKFKQGGGGCQWLGSKCVPRCPNCQQWPADKNACQSCEFNLFNRKTTISTYDFGTVTEQQQYVDIKWLGMNLSSNFGVTNLDQCTNKDIAFPRIVEKVADPAKCTRVGGQLQCYDLKDGCGGCDELGGILPESKLGFVESRWKDFELPEIVGMDYASPEDTCYTKEGVQQVFAKNLDPLYAAKKAKNEYLVYHVHCGEGSGIFDKEYYFRDYPVGESAYFTGWKQEKFTARNNYNLKQDKFNELCATAQKPYDKQEHLKVVYCGHFEGSGDMRPCHALVARNNIDHMADGIAAYRVGKKGFDELVTTRLGHATWSTYALAEKLVEANIQVDINLASNLATQAYSWPMGSDGTDLPRPKAIFSFDPTRQSVAIHDHAELSKQKAMLIRGFANHGFLPLFMAGVRMSSTLLCVCCVRACCVCVCACVHTPPRSLPTVGSDGAGVEHSSQSLDYKIAEILLDHMRATEQSATPGQGGKGWTPTTKKEKATSWEHTLLQAHKWSKSSKKLDPKDWVRN